MTVNIPCSLYKDEGLKTYFRSHIFITIQTGYTDRLIVYIESTTDIYEYPIKYARVLCHVYKVKNFEKKEAEYTSKGIFIYRAELYD